MKILLEEALQRLLLKHFEDAYVRDPEWAIEDAIDDIARQLFNEWLQRKYDQ